MSGKRCPGCGETKGVEAFSRCKSKKDGLQSRCKSCASRYHAENREAIAERMRRYREENREELLDRNRRYRDENREAELERHRRYREENRETILEYQRRYHAENRETILECQRRRHAENRYMTREAATRNGEPYTPAEDAHILTSDEPVAVIAVDLGRTLAAVEHRRRKLRNEATA